MFGKQVIYCEEKDQKLYTSLPTHTIGETYVVTWAYQVAKQSGNCVSGGLGLCRGVGVLILSRKRKEQIFGDI